MMYSYEYGTTVVAIRYEYCTVCIIVIEVRVVRGGLWGGSKGWALPVWANYGSLTSLIPPPLPSPPLPSPTTVPTGTYYLLRSAWKGPPEGVDIYHPQS